jgi:hypothetical protein
MRLLFQLLLFLLFPHQFHHDYGFVRRIVHLV